MDGKTYVIRDGVRRAKVAWLLGHADIWARVEGEPTERKIPVEALRSPKQVIDPTEKGGTRWANVLDGMSHEPDVVESRSLLYPAATGYRSMWSG